jgi:ADP-ribose pyrophosphatase YjhB (NUDIX family)
MTNLTAEDRKTITAMAVSYATRNNIGADPTKPAEHIGWFGSVKVHMVHASDPIITDGTLFVAVVRTDSEGMDKVALPGGFMDDGETAIQTSRREGLEETGFETQNAEVIGQRIFDGSRSIRVADPKLDIDGTMAKLGIKEGEIFVVSAQPVLHYVADLSKSEVKAGADVKAARVIPIEGAVFSIPDHKAMVENALKRVAEIKDANPAAEAKPNKGGLLASLFRANR